MTSLVTSPKRFYKKADVEKQGTVFHLMLDGRKAMTPGRLPLAVPSEKLARTLAQEWDAQEGTIDPARMPITRIVNSAIDGVAQAPAPVVDDLVKYAGSDLVCYRAGGPEKLVAAQNDLWDPVIHWAKERLQAPFSLAEGVIAVKQPPETLAAMRKALEKIQSPLGLAALHVMTTLSGSVLIALMQGEGALSVEDAWRAAHVDETFQESLWGTDLEAARRRDARREDFNAAALVYALSNGDAATLAVKEHQA